MGRFDQRQGFLISSIVHLMLMMALINRVTSHPKAKDQATPLGPVKEHIFLPSRELLKQLAPPPARRAPAPVRLPWNANCSAPPARRR